ncbi:helix-turn-helix domain-containing protein [Enterococcus hirae]|uniref:helix-turn-helix domain-containing protein n=1 Tax=Enterococcus TaxID=1350 RepID=UPI001964262C|nr:helix-turn-helix domain-containing protein [Enterococcus hirae]EMF0036612.1 helix-turn-helix domain-containing protein [Enterococcus hirae]EMF0047335.1 helix-turn-helix domain-containing protein [Enterococcus hirae]EMF0085741.1 helix-turn-helix domain-containing protein [Enterococcus hirae]EMF0107194.1 helix-turn-helix domain-containing protein [Enterococcus hirae]EMF0158429.1 helix-turn-helix domain-containing protein [Enterococcus hirae]
MKIEQLLEKKEQLQVLILRDMVLHGGTVGTNQLREQVNLSKTSFDQYIAEIPMIGMMMGKKVAIKRNEFQVTLELAEDVSLEKIILFLVQQSLKFNLLVYLLEHHQASIVRLATAFNISESSVFRKIKELNQLLQEFSLQIKNGQLYGEELQVRYFYYVLFQFISESQRPLFLQQTPDKAPLILGLERALETTFSQESASKIACWLGITRKRLLSEKTTFATLKEKKILYQKDRLYQALDPVISLYLSRTAAEISGYEPLMFYSFFVSFAVLSEEHFYQYDLTRSKKLPTAVLDTYIRETMLWHYRPRKLKIKEEKAVGYQLAQIDNEFYFFRGVMTIYEPEHLLQQQKKMLGRSLSQLLERLKETTLTQLPAKQGEEAALSYLMIQYANILMMIDFYIAKSVTIGIDIETLPIYRVAFQQFLLRELKGISGIEIENRRPGKKYDLVITFNQEDPHQNYYYLSEFASSYDIARLKQKIEEEKKAKN